MAAPGGPRPGPGGPRPGGFFGGPRRRPPMAPPPPPRGFFGSRRTLDRVFPYGYGCLGCAIYILGALAVTTGIFLLIF